MNYNLYIENYTNTSLQCRKKIPKEFNVPGLNSGNRAYSLLKGTLGKARRWCSWGGDKEDLLWRAQKETGAMKGEKEKMSSDFNWEVAGG